MTDLTITIDLAEIAAFAEVLGQAPAVVAAETQATLEKALGVLEQAIVAETPVNTGLLRGSIATQIKGASPNLTGEVLTPSVYGLPVEYGRKAGKPPPTAAIELWVQRKLGLSGDEAHRAAYLIARAIGRHGTHGAQMFEKGFAAAEPVVIRLFDELPERILAQLGGL